MTLLRCVLPLALVLAAGDVRAEDDTEEGEGGGWVTAGNADLSSAEMELDEQSAWAALEALPPRFSWEMAVQASFGDIAYWREHAAYTGPYIGQGIRGGWGRNFEGGHRIGIQTIFSVEGPVPLYYSMSLEPLASWDLVTHGIQVGASLGPSFMIHQNMDEGVFPGIAPAVAVRMGISQSWTRVGRRVFVVLEPHARLVKGEPSLMAALVIGQGRGR